MLDRYVVCTNHFTKKDYRNPLSKCLNTTAIPHLDTTALPYLDSTDSEPEDFRTEPEPIASSPTFIVDLPQQSQKSPLKLLPSDDKSPYKLVVLPSGTYSMKRRLVSGTIDKRKKHQALPQAIQLTYDENSTQEKHNDIQESDSIEIKIINDDKPSEEEIEIDKCNCNKQFAETGCQTETVVKEEDLTEIYKIHPQFRTKKKADLIDELLAKEEKIKELESKLEKFTVAMSAFKMLMNT